MKRILCAFLTALLLVSGFSLGTGAEIISGRALDEDWILDRDSLTSGSNNNSGSQGEASIDGMEGANLDADDIEAYTLAPYYRMEYTLDTETGELNIFCGKGEDGEIVYQQMLPYAKASWVPWMKSNQKKKIKTAIIHDGVQSVGRYSFYNCDTLETVYIPHSVVKINRTTFYNCDNLKTIYYAGTEKDFFYNILYDSVRNGVVDDVTGDQLTDIRDLIHYGESVGVVCKNQDGQTFYTYTVGGYFAGDKYTIVPKEMEGMTYTGEKSEITGKFKNGDDTVYVLEYTCEHEYIVEDPSKPCGKFCIYCGQIDPETKDEHEWQEPAVTSERGMLTPLQQSVTCKVCGAKVEEFKQPYILYVGVIGSGVVIGTAVILAIVIPIRRRKKLRDMTW